MPDHGWKIGGVLFSLLASVGDFLLLGPPLEAGYRSALGGLIFGCTERLENQRRKNQADVRRHGNKLVWPRDVAASIPAVRRKWPFARMATSRSKSLFPKWKKRSAADRADHQPHGQSRVPHPGQLSHQQKIIERALAEPGKMQVLDASGALLAWWVPVKPEELPKLSSPDFAHRTRKVGVHDVTEILVVNDNLQVNGGYLTQSTASTDDKGQPVRSVHVQRHGGQLFGELTGNHLPTK